MVCLAMVPMWSFRWEILSGESYIGKGNVAGATHEEAEVNLQRWFKKTLGKNTEPPQFSLTKSAQHWVFPSMVKADWYMVTRSQLIQDGELVSEALIFAPTPEDATSQVWPSLESNKGRPKHPRHSLLKAKACLQRYGVITTVPLVPA